MATDIHEARRRAAIEAGYPGQREVAKARAVRCSGCGATRVACARGVRIEQLEDRTGRRTEGRGPCCADCSHDSGELPHTEPRLAPAEEPEVTEERDEG